jgi:tRNA(Ile)-lysidine synthase
MPAPGPLRERLLVALAAVVAEAGSARVALAVSGGLDSALLLHLAPEALSGQRAAGQIRVLHVDHGLAAERGLWCRTVAGRARALGLDFRALAVSAAPPAGESIEAWLRSERYRLLAAELTPDEALLVAHHLDDQAETFLLQALRAAGPAGLAGMPALARLGRGWLLRPWLDVPRAWLEAVARAEGLDWHEDPSNADTRFDRNHLRRVVMPALGARWPAAARTLARAARWQAEAAQALDAAAACLLPALSDRDARGLPTLDIAALQAHAPALQRVLLRAWLARAGSRPAGARHIEAILALMRAAADAPGAVCWGRMRVRRHRDRLHFDPVDGPAPAPLAAAVRWQPPSPIELPGGRLWASLGCEGPGRLALDDAPCWLLARQGGERIRPSGDRHSRSLKGLLQRAGIPPWQRALHPLVYRAGQLVAVPGLCVADRATAAPHEPGWLLHWAPGRTGGASADVVGADPGSTRLGGTGA